MNARGSLRCGILLENGLGELGTNRVARLAKGQHESCRVRFHLEQGRCTERGIRCEVAGRQGTSSGYFFGV